MSPAFLRRLPWVLLTVTVVLSIAMFVLSVGQEELFDTLLYGVLALTLGTTGALIASRQPSNPIGWIFCAQGVWGSVVETWEAFVYNGLPTAAGGEWLVSWSWLVDLTAYAVVFLLFPTGRLMTRRWRLVLWILAAALLLAIPGQALSTDNPESFAAGGNPLGVDSPLVGLSFMIGTPLLMVGMIASIASVIVRFRRATGVERLQLRQFVLAGSVIIPACALAIPFYYESAAVQVVVALAVVCLPAAAAMAILRYRLYDIDVVINRALVYGSLTLTLAASYLGTVLLLQLALNPLTGSSNLAIAGSTLAVAALFQPARRRIQSAVDHRFYRRKYDAAQTLERFGARLRDEVELSTLSDDLRAVVSDTMQPAHVTLWLRAPEAGR